MFTLQNKEGTIVPAMSSDVDELAYASKPGHEVAINDVLRTFSFQEVNDTPVRCCVKEV